MMRKVLIAILLLFHLSIAKPLITTTVKPLSDIAKEVCKEACKVEYIIPPNVDVHHYEYKYSDLKKVYKADIFLFIGSGEPQIKSITKNIPDDRKLPVYKIKGLLLIHSFEFEEENHNEHHHDEHFHPAVWLDPVNAIYIANAVKEKLIKLDPKNKDIYEKNFKAFKENVENLVKTGKEKLSGLKNKNFVSYHYLFPYFTKRFNLNYAGIIQVGHGREPTIKHILKIIKIIKEKKIPSIFASKQFANEKYLSLIRKSVDVKVIKVDPFGENSDYLKTIENLINKVYQGLKDG